MMNLKYKVFPFLILILIVLVLYFISFRTNFTFVRLPELLSFNETALSSPYKCIAGPSTCNNEGHYQPNSVRVLNGIYISVRTSIMSHRSRLAPLLVTWLQTISPNQVYILTDTGGSDKWLSYSQQLGYTVRHAPCLWGYNSHNLCCKSGADFNGFYEAIEAGKKYGWFCHIDDDMYINIPLLVSTLQEYNPFKEFRYIGRHPWPPRTMDIRYMRALPDKIKPLWTTFRYAGGPVYCLSYKLMKDVEKYLRGTAFIKACADISNDVMDDVALGSMVQLIRRHNFTEVPKIHFQHMRMTNPDPDFKNQISVNLAESYVFGSKFSQFIDQTKYLSFHCKLYPETKWCNSNIQSVEDVILILLSKDKNMPTTIKLIGQH